MNCPVYIWLGGIINIAIRIVNNDINIILIIHQSFVSYFAKLYLNYINIEIANVVLHKIKYCESRQTFQDSKEVPPSMKKEKHMGPEEKKWL